MLEPNRTYVIEDDGSIHKMLFCGDADWEENVTTSVQEIRAKAIDEFVKEIRDWQIDIQDNERDADKFDFVFERIYEIAEEMRGAELKNL